MENKISTKKTKRNLAFLMSGICLTGLLAYKGVDLYNNYQIKKEQKEDKIAKTIYFFDKNGDGFYETCISKNSKNETIFNKKMCVLSHNLSYKKNNFELPNERIIISQLEKNLSYPFYVANLPSKLTSQTFHFINQKEKSESLVDKFGR